MADDFAKCILIQVDEVTVPLTGDAVCLLAERLKVDPVFAVVQQFCRNGGGSDELALAVADVQQMSKNMYACLMSSLSSSMYSIYSLPFCISLVELSVRPCVLNLLVKIILLLSRYFM